MTQPHSGDMNLERNAADGQPVAVFQFALFRDHLVIDERAVAAPQVGVRRRPGRRNRAAGGRLFVHVVA